MDMLKAKMVLIDNEIDKLVSKKKYIDIRLTKLYTQREDLVVEYENLNKPCNREMFFDD